MTALPTDKLAELIRKKQQVLVQLREIGIKQHALEGESATTQLLQLLGAKQHLIAALQIVERNLRPFQAEDPEQREWRTQEDRQACALRAEACNELLQEVMELERQQETKMIERRDKTAEKLKRAGSAHRAIGAYSRHGGVSQRPHYQDPGPTSNSIDLTSETN